MKILVINPVGTPIWDELTLKHLKQIANPGTEIVVKSLPQGPETIESEFDKALAEKHVVEVVARELLSGKGRYDAVIINCFDDPGVKALREVVRDALVLGIGETSITAALMLGFNIAIISTGKESKAIYRRRAAELGLLDRVTYTSGIELPVLKLREDEAATLKALEEESRRAVKEYGAEVIVLGCGGMIGMAQELSNRVGVPVVDPTKTTFKVTEALVAAGLKHSYAYVPPHAIKRFQSLVNE